MDAVILNSGFPEVGGMRVTIITVVYNRVESIASAIRSVSSQSYPNIEYIVIDGASSDGTLKIVEDAYNFGRVSNYISEPDGGIYEALNKGIQMASGEVIGILHSDDTFSDSTVVEEIANQLHEDTCSGVYGDLIYVSDYDSRVLREWRAGNVTSNKLRFGWMPPHPTVFLKKEVFDDLGFYDPKYRISADYDFMLRVFLGQKYRLTYIPRVLVSMRSGGASNGSLAKLIQKTSEDLRIISHHGLPGWFTVCFKMLRKLPQWIPLNKRGLGIF